MKTLEWKQIRHPSYYNLLLHSCLNVLSKWQWIAEGEGCRYSIVEPCMAAQQQYELWDGLAISRYASLDEAKSTAQKRENLSNFHGDMLKAGWLKRPLAIDAFLNGYKAWSKLYFADDYRIKLVLANGEKVKFIAREFEYDDEKTSDYMNPYIKTTATMTEGIIRTIPVPTPETDFTKLSDKALVGIIDGLADYFHTECVSSEDMPLSDFYSMAGAAQELYRRKNLNQKPDGL